jgi:hypothetical protein
MSTQEEMQDLEKNPLPEQKIENPLTLAYLIDGDIAQLQEQISRMQENRQRALDYAVKHGITEDTKCRLETKVRKTRSLNITLFAAVFPEQYKMACTIEKKLLEEKMGAVGEKINLTLVDKLVPKKNLDEAEGVITVKESISYQVVSK